MHVEYTSDAVEVRVSSSDDDAEEDYSGTMRLTSTDLEMSFDGDDDRPLRPTQVSLVRVDRWEQVDQGWWVSPGKL